MRRVQYEDLRDWLAQADEWGELRTVKGIGLDEDVGRVAEISARTENGPVILFDEFPGYSPGFRIMLNPYGTVRRIGYTFGFPEVTQSSDLAVRIREKKQQLELIPPEYVETGPILQNKLIGDEVDLFTIPTPKWHLHDGGYYIGTGDLAITQDPDDGWANFGAHRTQRFDKNSVGVFFGAGQHGEIIREKYFSRGQPCPVAVVVGSDPLFFAASMTEVPFGVSEYDWVGGWRGEPVKVVKAPVTGLPIPANAEIVIDGYCYPGKNKLMAPFGEWPGYYVQPAVEEPLIEVKGLYFRDNPIVLGMPPQRPPYDADKCRQFIRSAELYHRLQAFGITGLKNVWCHALGACRLLIVASIEQQYCGHSRNVGHVIAGSFAARTLSRYVVVVDDDIDATDWNEVTWAMLTRSDPATSIDIIPRTGAEPDPRLSPMDRAAGKMFGSVAIVDATKPYEWKDRYAREVQPDPAYRKESREKFGYIFDK